MQRSLWRQVIQAATAVTLLVAGSTTYVSAQDVLAARLTALLGQERQALAEVPSARLSALTTPPSDGGQTVTAAPVAVEAFDEVTLAAMPAATGDDQWQCLTEALYFESRGEDLRGVFAVGEVVLNRVDSGIFPNSVCGVIHQGTGSRFACQFSYTCDGRAETISEPAAWDRMGKVARLLLDGAPRTLTDGATFYHADSVSPSWSRRFAQTATIGSHVFYRQPTRSAMN